MLVAYRRILRNGMLVGFEVVKDAKHLGRVSIHDRVAMKEVNNIHDVQGEVKCKTNSLDRLPSIDLVTREVSNRNELTILKVEQNINTGECLYTVINSMGIIEKLMYDRLVRAAQRYGSVNFKLVERYGRLTISAIVGEFDVEKTTGRSLTSKELLSIKQSMANRPLDDAKYLYKKAPTIKGVRSYKLIFKYRLPGETAGAMGRRLTELSNPYPKVRGKVDSKISEVVIKVRKGKIHTRGVQHYSNIVEAAKTTGKSDEEFRVKAILDYLNYAVINAANPKHAVPHSRMLVEAHAQMSKADDKKAALYITAMFADLIQLENNSDGAGTEFPYICRDMRDRAIAIGNTAKGELPKVYKDIIEEMKFCMS